MHGQLLLSTFEMLCFQYEYVGYQLKRQILLCFCTKYLFYNYLRVFHYVWFFLYDLFLLSVFLHLLVCMPLLTLC